MTHASVKSFLQCSDWSLDRFLFLLWFRTENRPLITDY